MALTGLYKAKVTKVDGTILTAFIPQVFGDASVQISDIVGTAPTSSEMGWVAFQGGNREYPVWFGTGVAGSGTAGGVQDVMWVSTTAPSDPDIEMWYDTDEVVAAVGPKVDLYSVPGTYTWTMPALATRVRIEGVGAGTGGGAGRRGAAGTVRCGGGGGGSAGYSWIDYAASDLPATLTVLVSPGTAGAPAVTVDDTNGGTAANSANSAVYSGTTYYFDVRGATGGSGGTNA